MPRTRLRPPLSKSAAAALQARRAARERRVVELYTRKKMSQSQVAKAVGVSSTRVHQILTARGVKKRSNGWATPELPRNRARNDRVVRMYRDENLPARVIADKLGLTESGVTYILRARGVPRKPNGYYPKPTPLLTRRLRAYAKSIAHVVGTGPGFSAIELARKAGFVPGTLRLHLRELGVRMRNGVSRAAGGRLNVEQVKEIKRLLAAGKTTQAALSKRYRVGRNTIWAIAAGDSWPDVPWPDGKPPARRGRKRPQPARARARSRR